MTVEVSGKVTPTLHPDNVMHLDGYNESTANYVNELSTAMSDIYHSIHDVHVARDTANRNEAWTEATCILKTADMTAKFQSSANAKLNSCLSNLERGYFHNREELTKPVQVSASTGALNSEIRTHFKSLDASERRAQVSAAVVGDHRTATALLGAPAYLSGLSDIEHAEHLNKFNSIREPERVERMKVQKAGIDMVKRLQGLISDEFTKALGSDWGKVERLRKANSEAERAFITR